MALLWVLGALVLAAGLRRYVGFTSQRPDQWVGKGPQFDPRHDLAGPILCEGVIYGPFGRVTSRFVAQMHGEWDGNRGVLHENFSYDNGTSQVREWHLLVGNDGTIEATAPDVVGQGSGRVSGPTVQMLYNLRLPADAGGHVLNVVDWMYLTENGTIINRSQFRKFGIKVAELVATLRRVPA
ncbi:MAG: DUF3833 domain-containing protein [Cypionkella sp.]